MKKNFRIVLIQSKIIRSFFPFIMHIHFYFVFGLLLKGREGGRDTQHSSLYSGASVFGLCFLIGFECTKHARVWHVARGWSHVIFSFFPVCLCVRKIVRKQ